MTAGQLRYAITLLALIAIPEPAAADPLDAVRSWNLLGTWAPDCEKPPALDNTHATYVQRGRNVHLDRNFGGGSDSHPIVAASAQKDGTLSISIAFTKPAQTRVNVFAKGKDGRIRTLASHDGKGRYSVKNGKLVGAGRQTEWLSRCEPERTAG